RRGAYPLRAAGGAGLGAGLLRRALRQARATAPLGRSRALRLAALGLRRAAPSPAVDRPQPRRLGAAPLAAARRERGPGRPAGELDPAGGYHPPAPAARQHPAAPRRPPSALAAL